MGRPVILKRVRWTTVLFAALWVGMASCSEEPARAPAETASAASTPGEMGEPHDQSAFGKDPSETHLMSPDEPDLHPQPEPGRAEPR